MRMLIAAAAALLCAGAAFADTVSSQFGNRVTAFHQYKAPYLTADLDGDGTPDSVYLVAIAAGSGKVTIAKDVKVIGDLFASHPLGNAAENMAVGVVFGTSGKKYLLTGYRGDEYEDFFDAMWWNAKSAPIRVVARGSMDFKMCQVRNGFLKNDYLSLKAGEDYEQFVWWNGSAFKPEPISPDHPACTMTASDWKAKK